MPEHQVICNLTSELPPMRFGGLEVSLLERRRSVMPWGFGLLVDPIHEEDGCCRAQFDARLHDPQAVAVFIAGYQRVASAVVQEPDCPLERLAATAAP